MDYEPFSKNEMIAIPDAAVTAPLTTLSTYSAWLESTIGFIYMLSSTRKSSPKPCPDSRLNIRGLSGSGS